MARLTLHFIIHQDFSHIHQALDSLAQSAIDYVCMVTVNAGTSADVQALRQAHPEIQLIVNDFPKGFAENHNQAMLRAKTEYVALLNDDVLFEPASLKEMLAYLDAHPQVALASPLIVRATGEPQVCAYDEPHLWRMLIHYSGLMALAPQGGQVRRMLQCLGIGRQISLAKPQTRLVPVVVGVAMFVRRSIFTQVGGMDEYTRMYGEEFGWMRRIREVGFGVALVTSARLIHLNPAQDLSGWKLAEHRKGTLAYFVRYRSAKQAKLLRGALIFFYGLRVGLVRLFKPELVEDYWSVVQMARQYRRDASKDGARYASVDSSLPLALQG